MVSTESRNIQLSSDRGIKATSGRKTKLSYNGASAVRTPCSKLKWYLKSYPKISLPAVTVYTSNPSAWEAEVGELGVQVQLGLHSKTLSPK